MDNLASIVVKREGAGDGPRRISELVMAYANDKVTGQLRYILELGYDRRGSKCGCVCPSCGLDLTAVNAAKSTFHRRPHFRHPGGAVRDDCVVLTARVAAMSQLVSSGWIKLPRRRRQGRVAGLSGQFHEAWVVRPSERVRLRDFDFRDRVTALLTLEDGRQLRVLLTGGLAKDADDNAIDDGIATIVLAADDPALAGTDPVELRQRLSLLLEDSLCWRSHWDDAAMEAQAADQAHDLADLHLDLAPDGLDLPADMDPELKRETVLHLAVKRLLMDSGELAAPAPYVMVGGMKWCSPFNALQLSDVQSEVRFKHVVPDISCTARWVGDTRPSWPLFIEVTVSNPIVEERRARIAAAGSATLEIDLSLAGGRVTRDELRRLVIEELAAKRWVFHPEREQRQAELELQQAAEAPDRRAEEARHETRPEIWQLRADELRAQAEAHARGELVYGRSLAGHAQDYLQAVADLWEAEATGRNLTAFATRQRIGQAVAGLVHYGHPEAADESLLEPEGIVALVLSIQLGRPVGFKGTTLRDVLDVVQLYYGTHAGRQTLCLMALAAFDPAMRRTDVEWCEAWRDQVRSSLQARHPTFLRDPTHDQLLAVLFPKLAASLQKRSVVRTPPRAGG